MNCEVCGKKIINRPVRVSIEGVILSVCNECSQLGEIINISKSKQINTKTKSIPTHTKPQKLLTKEILDFEIVKDYAQRIKNAREKANIKQEELAKKINEKLSVIQKIESGKMVPDLRLARILEHFLKIKLIVPKGEHIVPINSKIPELTFGDIVKIKSKDKKTL